MTKQEFAAIKRVIERFGWPDSSATILDIGSYDVNGSVSPLFVGCNYVGVDKRDGPNVNVKANAHNLKNRFRDEQFDWVVSNSHLEHDLCWWKSVGEMYRVLKVGGILVVGASTLNMPIHKEPTDYYRFTSDVFKDYILKGCQQNMIELVKRGAGHTFHIVGAGRKVANWRERMVKASA